MHHLIPYGWGPRVAALAAAHPTIEPARVVTVHRDRVLIASPDGLAGAWSTGDLPTVGDWIVVSPTPTHEVPWQVVGLLPRWSQLCRVDPVSHGQHNDVAQVVAANVDVVLLTHPLDRPVSVARIEREQVAVWDAGATPVVVLTKADCASDVGRVVEDVSRRLGAADVVVTSVVCPTGLEALAALAHPDRTVLLLGASGAGKTSLANALTGGRAAVGDVREADQRGRHTTTVRSLVPLPGGGVLLDAPGLRNFGLWGGDDGIDVAFADIAELASRCRFRDCGHDGEPGCAVQDALVDGSLDRSRLASWHKLQREIAAHERRADPVAAREHERQWRNLSRARRNDPHFRRKR